MSTNDYYEQQNSNEGPYFQVENILDRKIQPDQSYWYYVKWVGYPQPTWQPLDNLKGDKQVQRLINILQNKKKTKPNWQKGLTNWAQKQPKQNNQNLANVSHINNRSVIDLDTPQDNFTASLNPKSRIRSKITSAPDQRYPFEDKCKNSTEYNIFQNRIKAIKEVRSTEQGAKALVEWQVKGKKTSSSLILTDHIRLVDKQGLLKIYQQMFQTRMQNAQP